ncbi:phage tail protein [Pantoea sp. FN0307]|uniref:phage tail protein n=1 Tax=unclassified Pantoea TaxID=2630326 RepID=UPI003CF4EA6E
MSPLESLTAFITDALSASLMEGFSSRMESMKPIAAQRDMGLGQYRLAIIRYDVTLSWARFPYREQDPKLLMALLLAWLNQEDRSLYEEIGIDTELPVFTVSMNDDGTAAIVAKLPLVEALDLAPDGKGPIPFDGQRWRLEDAQIWIAEEAEVTSSVRP